MTRGPVEARPDAASGPPAGFRGKQVLAAVGVAAVLTIGFYATDLHMADLAARGRAFWSPALPWEAAVPFRPGWVWVYLLYFPVCFAPLFLRRVRDDPETFFRTALGFVAQFALSLAAFWGAPSRMLRPSAPGPDAAGAVLAGVYSLDPGFNIFPSLHVANSAFIACLVWRLRGAAWGAGLWWVCALIAAATLFVKQHYFLDLPAGLALGVGCYRLAFARFRVPSSG